MGIPAKVFLIICVFGFVMSFGMPITPYMSHLVYVIIAPITGIMAVFSFPYIGIPYYIVAFSLLYWWEKRKRNVKVETKNVV
jgi:membrane protein implicated in regulation of membrane protease activity